MINYDQIDSCLYTDDPKVAVALAALGDTTERAAHKLADLGITGRHDAVGCPLYNYLTQAGCQIRFIGPTFIGVGQHARHRMPEHLAVLVQQFDKGGRPELEASTE